MQEKVDAILQRAQFMQTPLTGAILEVCPELVSSFLIAPVLDTTLLQVAHGAPDMCCWCKVRDITTKPEWWEAYSLTIPVLTFSKDQGSREVDTTPLDTKTPSSTSLSSYVNTHDQLAEYESALPVPEDFCVHR